MIRIDPSQYFLAHPTSLEGTFIPPVNCVDLAAQTHLDFQFRFGKAAPHPAEVFHENSKRIRASTRAVAADQEAVETLIDRYMDTAYNPDPKSVGDLAASPIEVRQQWNSRLPTALHRLGLVHVRRHFSFDTLVLSKETLHRILPGKSIVWLEREYGPAQLQRFRAAFFGPGSTGFDAEATYAFIVGVPWRYMMLFGPRGYRLMLMDIGAILASLGAKSGDGPVQLVEHYYDNEVDRFLHLDGVEHSVQAILRCPPDVAAQPGKEG
jgi:hypothetical protein